MLGALGALIASTVMLALAAPALATTGHAFVGQFGAGSFNFAAPAGLAVNQTTGDVYASDPYNFDGPGGAIASRVKRFDSAGALQDSDHIVVDGAQYGVTNNLAVDRSGSDALYVAGSLISTGAGAVLKYTSAGVFVSALDPSPSGASIANPAALAVDPVDGTVYVGGFDAGSAPVILKFDSAGAYLATIDGSAGSPPDGRFANVSSIAVDGSHNVYVADNAKGRVDRYDATGAWQATVDDGSHGAPTAVTADGSTDEVFVVESGPAGAQVGYFSAGGVARVETFGVGRISSSSAIGVKESDGTVYTADSGQGSIEYFARFDGPTVATAPATSVGSVDATLHGTIDPEGITSTYHFEYGLDTSYGSSTPNVSAGGGSAPVAATATLTGLLPNAQYHARIVGSNGGGSIYGDDVTFTTLPAPPTLDATAPQATAITADGATLNATIDPRGSDTTYHFDYGTTDSYGSSTSDATTGVSQGDASFTADLTGLAPGTTYHFRVSADNGTGGVQEGVDQTFTTAPGTPAGALSATGVTANLTGVVDPHGSASTYRFEYGTTTAYGASTPEQDAGSGSGEQTVTAAIAKLAPGTTYHVRVVATDTATGVTTTGVDGTFETDPAPTAVTGAVTGLTTDRATLSGDVDTHGLAGSYRFFVESGTTTYQGETDPVAVGVGEPPAVVSGALTDLVPGQTYTVRLVVTSSGVTTIGDTVTFSTAPLATGAFPDPPLTVLNPYGCSAPSLKTYDRRPKPGDTISISGRDLGVSGAVRLGAKSLKPTGWTATGFKLKLPNDATGTLPLTVNCGKVSNTIAIQIYRPPSNSFTTRKLAAKGATVTLRIKVPGPGSITVRGAGVKRASKHAGKAGAKNVKVTLTGKAAQSLSRNHRLAVPLKVRFTPTGGTAKTKTVHVTFKRKASR